MEEKNAGGTEMNALIAMSGGVDSSVAAKLMQEKGYTCIGCTMRLYDGEDAGLKDRGCCSLDDVDDARSVARGLKIPYYVFNFRDEFREKVIEKFARCYAAGITPNPCIDCNRYMKFDALGRRAKVLGCETIATGHYARVSRENGRYVLRRAADRNKDQSYVLYCLSQEQLAHAAFPLGGLSKEQVRAIAADCGFINAKKRDSQDICFVPDGDYAGVVQHYCGPGRGKGPFTDTHGNVLGEHRGLMHYTVGQHRGLGLSYHERLYVCRICPESNTVVLGREEELTAGVIDADDFNWLSIPRPERAIRCAVKIRYRAQESPALVIPTGENSVRIQFDTPQKAPAPGQAAVLYDGDLVLGGGTICSQTLLDRREDRCYNK